MTNWHELETIALQAEALLKLVHVIGGIYIWDFFITCKYEWSIIKGRMPLRWTIWIYLGCRFFTLAEIVAYLTGLNLASPINCQLWVVLIQVFAYIAYSLALSLYGIRTIAIWRRQPYIIVFIAAISAMNIALYIHSISQTNSSWNPIFEICTFENSEKLITATLGTLAANVLILAVMMIGILKDRPGRRNIVLKFHREGVWWLFVATAVQILPSVFTALNLNYAMNLMFQGPSLVCSTIGATRIFRSIYDGYSGDLLHYMETSINAHGELHFRRRIVDYRATTSSPTVNVPMNRFDAEAYNMNRFVERFQAREIKLDGADVDSPLHIDEDLKESQSPYTSNSPSTAGTA